MHKNLVALFWGLLRLLHLALRVGDDARPTFTYRDHRQDSHGGITVLSTLIRS